jgi:hypothetical protein
MPSARRALIDPCSGRTLKICPAVPGSTAVICSTLPRITAAPVLSPVAAATCGSAFSFWASAGSTPPVVPAPELITKSPANDRSTLALIDAVVEEAKIVMNRPGRRRSSAPRSAGAVIWYRPMEDPTGSAISGPPARAN